MTLKLAAWFLAWLLTLCRPSALLLTLSLAGCWPSASDGGDTPPVAATAPQIGTQPQAQAVVLGQPATFSVVASGTGPLSYVWLRNGVAVAGATAASYSFTPALVDSGATFSVQVTNGVSSVTSAAAGLTVTSVLSIRITSQPQAAAAIPGGAVVFTVAAQATAANAVLAYEWLRDGAPIAGATSASYTTPALAIVDNGARYSVRISSGSATPVLSSDALLTVQASAASVLRATLGAGGSYSLALRADGTVLVWGTGMSGGAGAALAGTSSARVVSGLSGIAAVVATPAVAAGFNKSLALATDGSVQGWGYTLAASPAPLAALGQAVQVQTCLESNIWALQADGSVRLRTTSGTSTVAGLNGVSRIAAVVGSNTCELAAVRADGSVVIVTGNQISVVGGLPANIEQVSCALDEFVARYCLARTRAGRVWAWGSNFKGQLGDGSTTARSVPFELAVPQNVGSIAAGSGNSYALTTSGQVYSWGALGGVGRNVVSITELYAPTLVSGLPQIVELTAGGHVLVRGLDGSVWGWGLSNLGDALGTGNTGDGFLPVQARGIQLN